MLVIPDRYKVECEPATTTYGRFLASYHMHKRAKHNRVQAMIDSGQAVLPSMSKLDFMKRFLLNEDFTVDDMLGVKDPSLRGFLYEAMWDICIKCNVVPELDNRTVYHMEGKIEELRTRIRRRLRSLRPIDNMYEYLKNSKVQSGNTGGVSDITTRARSKKDESYTLISCKFFVNEKAITKYDVAGLVHAMQGADVAFQIVLLVNNRASFLAKMQHAHKQHTRDMIHAIYDRTDLVMYVARLRSVFRLLGSIDTRSLKLWHMYLGSSWKPMLDIRFHTLVIGNTPATRWHSCMPSVIDQAILYKILTNIGRTHFVVCNDRRRAERLRAMLDEHFALNYATVRFGTALPSSRYDIVYALDLLRADPSHGHGELILAYTHYMPASALPIPDVRWNMGDCMRIRAGDFAHIPQAILELAIGSMYGRVQGQGMDVYRGHVADSYREYPDVILAPFGGTADAVFGTAATYQERWVVFNAMERILDPKDARVLLIAPKADHAAILSQIAASPVAVQRMGMLAAFEMSDGIRNAPDRGFNTVIVMGDSCSPVHMYEYISRLYDSRPDALLVFDENASRLENVQKMIAA